MAAFRPPCLATWLFQFWFELVRGGCRLSFGIRGIKLSNDYIRQTLCFLRKSDLQFSLPTIRLVELQPNGTEYVKNGSYSNSNFNTLNQNKLLVAMVVFSLMDSFVDLKYPGLEGDSFNKRYKGLPNTKDNEIIFKEIYRIFKIIRNATIHSRNSITTLADKIQIQYTFKGTHKDTQFIFNCDINTINLIYSYLILYVELDGISTPYYDSLFRSYYDKIKSGITDFNDEFGDRLSLGLISSRLRLKINVRYIINNPDVEFDQENDLVKFNRYKVDEGYEEYYGADYYVNYNNLKYLIPDELLGDNEYLPIHSFLEWEYSGIYPVF